MSPTSTSEAAKGPAIEKKILHAGVRQNNNEEIKHQQGTKVCIGCIQQFFGQLNEFCKYQLFMLELSISQLLFHFTTHTTDGTLLDDSRKWDKPMEIIMGKKFKLEV